MSLSKLNPQLSYCQTENIDIQCFSEINQNMSKHNHRKKFHDSVRMMDRSAKGVWSNTDIPMESEYKPGGVGIVSFRSVAGRVKECGQDRLGRWCLQVGCVFDISMLVCISD